jgi:hypothetical protein
MASDRALDDEQNRPCTHNANDLLALAAPPEPARFLGKLAQSRRSGRRDASTGTLKLTASGPLLTVTPVRLLSNRAKGACEANVCAASGNIPPNNVAAARRATGTTPFSRDGSL